jgi:hypothetical protein
LKFISTGRAGRTVVVGWEVDASVVMIVDVDVNIDGAHERVL